MIVITENTAYEVNLYYGDRKMNWMNDVTYSTAEEHRNNVRAYRYAATTVNNGKKSKLLPYFCRENGEVKFTVDEIGHGAVDKEEVDCAMLWFIHKKF